MKKVAVGVDGSDSANAALGVACDLAVKNGAQLFVCHAVTDEPFRGNAFRFAVTEFGDKIAARLRDVALGSGHVPVEITEDAISADRDWSAAMNGVVGEGLLEAAEATAQRAGVTSIERRLLTGSPGAQLVDFVIAEAPDVLVVGTRGLGGVERLLMGSVSGHVARAPCMVITVKLAPPP
ncbi:universal stress protein [Prosthecomicrobium sp. N25]|uniref:universal stress protein n=1 Tax=Prosthecomicrobium sp. N25 TaxID=3129254 RepID=UPI00307890D1